METDFAADKSAPAMSQAIQALLDRRGVPKSKRLVVLEAALGIAYQQVRRRMMGETAWTVEDIKRIAAHFGEPVFRLLGALVDDEAGQPAVLQVAGAKLACSIWPAPQSGPGIGPYVAVPGDEAQPWSVVLAAEAAGREAFGIRRLVLEPEPPRRVAVVDDDAPLVQAIVEFLRLKGLDAIGYTNAEQLRTALETTHFDGCILDWLVGTVSADELLPLLRARNPTGPIIILTGQLGAAVQESELASAMAVHRLQLYEKPSRTLSLFNALQRGFEASPRAR
jgi:CheY-like chemotaxis protein